MFNNSQQDCKLFIGGLDEKTTKCKYLLFINVLKDDLDLYFSHFGEILSSVIMTNKARSKILYNIVFCRI